MSKYSYEFIQQLENELDSANNTLTTLHGQLRELQQSDAIFKVNQKHDESVSSLRKRHESELFRLHKEISKLNAEAKSKVRGHLSIKISTHN